MKTWLDDQPEKTRLYPSVLSDLFSLGNVPQLCCFPVSLPSAPPLPQFKTRRARPLASLITSRPQDRKTRHTTEFDSYLGLKAATVVRPRKTTVNVMLATTLVIKANRCVQ
jgi:hypothetical protein